MTEAEARHRWFVLAVVGAAFYIVARGEVVGHDDLPGAAEHSDLVSLTR